jgi:hypothetical protein
MGTEWRFLNARFLPRSSRNLPESSKISHRPPAKRPGRLWRSSENLGNPFGTKRNRLDGSSVFCVQSGKEQHGYAVGQVARRRDDSIAGWSGQFAGTGSSLRCSKMPRSGRYLSSCPRTIRRDQLFPELSRKMSVALGSCWKAHRRPRVWPQPISPKPCHHLHRSPFLPGPVRSPSSKQILDRNAQRLR